MRSAHLLAALLVAGLGFPAEGMARRADPASEAASALARLGIPARRVHLRIVPTAQSAYRVRIVGDRIEAEGSTPVALVHGLVQALQRQGRVSISWEGDRIGPLTGLADRDTGLVTSPFALRNYLNTCTFGYTSPWWGWSRWSREIDWMATRGIDAPLAMEGQEYVWAALWREQGLNAREVAASLSAAPFLPWQRMGNVAGYRGPLSANWIARKHILQKRILTRMRALGMKPILPAFSGYVPEAFAKAHPEAQLYRMRPWEGFPGTWWLDPSDPLFARLQRRFIELYTREYGPGQYYLADAFNEMVPPIGDASPGAGFADSRVGTSQSPPVSSGIAPRVRDARLAAYGERLYRSIAEPAPGAVWVMQGWMFGADKAFWTPDAIRAFLSRVPSDRLQILDIGNDRYPGVWARTEAFFGKTWTYGYVHNYGGSNPVYGDLDFYRRDMAGIVANPARGRLAAFGMFPEGLGSNSIVYAYAYDLAWGEDPARPVGAWLGEYLTARYGDAPPALLAGWERAARGVYSTAYWKPRWWNDQAGAYLLFKRPSLEGASYDSPPGSRTDLRVGLDALLAAAPSRPSALLTYDLVEFARHFATLELDDRLARAIAAYQRGDLAAGDADAARVTRLAMMIDGLLGNQQETLGTWIAEARAYAATPAERARFAQDAKAVVTVWGGEGHLSDYASRAWQGLYAGYYLPRWQIFLATQRRAVISDKPFDEPAARAEVARFERMWLADGRQWPRRRPAEPIVAIRRILKEVDRPGQP